MNEEQKAVPDCLYTVHPGGGQCGARGLIRESRISASGQYVFRCVCGFRWYLFPSEIAKLMHGSPAIAECQVQPGPFDADDDGAGTLLDFLFRSL